MLSFTVVFVWPVPWTTLPSAAMFPELRLLQRPRHYRCRLRAAGPRAAVSRLGPCRRLQRAVQRGHRGGVAGRRRRVGAAPPVARGLQHLDPGSAVQPGRLQGLHGQRGWASAQRRRPVRVGGTGTEQRDDVLRVCGRAEQLDTAAVFLKCQVHIARACLLGLEN